MEFQLAENQAESLKIQEKLANSEVYEPMQDDAFAKSEVATNEELKKEQAGSNRKIAVDVHQQILKLQKGQPLYKGATEELNVLKNRTI